MDNPLDSFDKTTPLPSIYPKEWSDVVQGSWNILFDNLDHFIYKVSKMSQKQDDKCGVYYASALEKLKNGESDFPEEEQESIRNLVRSNLFKRGLITEEVYENFRYGTDGTQVDVDVGKYAAGEPDCVIIPNRVYIDYFYELYINISYSYTVTNEQVRKNVAKLLATVEELERQHIYIKINTVFPASGVSTNSEHPHYFFSSIPLFSHKDRKSVSTMSAVINDRLLRKFYFAILENLYKSDLSGNYGTVVQLPKTMNIGEEFDEVELFEEISKASGMV